MKLYLKLTIVVLGLAAGNVPLLRGDETSPVEQAAPAAAAAASVDWVRTGESLYGWKWLSDRYDSDSDGIVTRADLPVADEVFARLDRTWDDRLTSDDFDWSRDGPLCRQKETTFALFKSVDKNSDGRIALEEWQDLFAKAAQDNGHINEEELEQLIYLPRVLKAANEAKLRAGRSKGSNGGRRASNAAPQPGDVAPDFSLQSPDGKTSVRLSSFQGKRPVVLVFGCYTCGNYRTYSESMEELYQFWKEEVEFVRVYVREAHPVADDQSATPTNAAAGILIRQPSTFQERCTVAAKFASALGIETPLVVDAIDNRVGQAYGAWPDRLYVVDREGRVAFAGGPGPFGFNPREMEQSLVMVLLNEKKVLHSK